MLTLLFEVIMKNDKNKSYTLTPSWKYFFFAYLLSILTIPIIIGLAVLYFLRKRHKSLHYTITDTQITAGDSKYQQNIDLVNIQKIEIDRNWLHEKLGIGSLVIHSSASKMFLLGLERPKEIKEIIERVVDSLQNQPEAATREKMAEPEYDPGSMEKMNYLTGLWQQGLISDEDYKKERKHFE